VDGVELTPGASAVGAGTGGTASATLEAIAARSAAQMSAENFPVALRILPRRPRAQLALVYGFARFIDDVGDTGDTSPAERLQLLDEVEADLRALGSGQSTLTPVRALRALTDGGQVPLDPFLDLVEANRVDQRVSRYPAFGDLLAYCRLSAAPIGRLVLYVAGAATDVNVADSDAVCAALQVLEHCQDVGEDAQAGRIYLPADELAAAAIGDEELLGSTTGGRLRSVISVQAQRSVELLGLGTPLVRRLSGWARIAVAGYVGGGLATADALRRADYDVLAQAVKPGRGRTAAHALRLLAGR
jgi:squalene synthase HpnC